MQRQEQAGRVLILTKIISAGHQEKKQNKNKIKKDMKYIKELLRATGFK